MKSAVRISQLILLKNVWGIACEIQGVSMVEGEESVQSARVND